MHYFIIIRLASFWRLACIALHCLRFFFFFFFTFWTSDFLFDAGLHFDSFWLWRLKLLHLDLKTCSSGTEFWWIGKLTFLEGKKRIISRKLSFRTIYALGLFLFSAFDLLLDENPSGGVNSTVNVCERCLVKVSCVAVVLFFDFLWEFWSGVYSSLLDFFFFTVFLIFLGENWSIDDPELLLFHKMSLKI